jgi:hypothetical protein
MSLVMALALTLFGAGPCAAADGSEAPAAVSAAADEAASAAIVARPNPFGIKPVELKVLARKRGGTDVVSDAQLRGVVSDNRAVNVATGANVISDGAFAGMSGLPMVVQNSGNNVLIQNSTIVNVQVK